MIDYNYLDKLVHDSLEYLHNLCYRGDPTKALEVAKQLEALYNNALSDVMEYMHHAESRLQRGEKTTILDVTTLKEIDDRLYLNDPESIQQYITRYIQLANVLPEAIKIARKRLPDATFVLSIYQDPEIYDDKYLLIEVQLEKYPNKILDKIGDVEEEIAQLLDPEDYFLIFLTTLFRKPGEIEEEGF